MAQGKAPNRVQRNAGFVDPRTGLLTEIGYQHLDQMWRQVAAGHVIVPCTVTGKNDIVLTPTLHKEGGVVLADGMTFRFVAAETSDAAVTIKVADQTARKAYVVVTQAAAGDVVAEAVYLAVYNSAFDTGAGGFSVK